MLAKDLMINSLNRQKLFIINRITAMTINPSRDGETSIRYIGEIFPQVRKFLEDEGFVITCCGRFPIGHKLGGYPLNLITIKDFSLTEEELEKAESVEVDSSYSELIIQLLNAEVESCLREIEENDSDCEH